MRMGVWEIMEFEKSRLSSKDLPKKPIEPGADRSKGNPKMGEEIRVTDFDYVTDSDKEPCRDCPEGMQW